MESVRGNFIAASQRTPRGDLTYGAWTEILDSASSSLVFLRILPRIFVIALALALIVQAFIVQSFYIPSSSMQPTLERDDCVVVPKFAYGIRVPFFDSLAISWSAPERGRVVVFHRHDDPATEINEGQGALVKRVIGIAGDEVSIEGHDVFVNGERIAEPYVRWTNDTPHQRISFTVPNSRVFLLGDNRDASYDSRFWSEPFVPLSKIVGPASAVYWSANRSARMVY
jgi:signal peptidase I